jgi:hypothetical protein
MSLADIVDTFDVAPDAVAGRRTLNLAIEETEAKSGRCASRLDDIDQKRELGRAKRIELPRYDRNGGRQSQPEPSNQMSQTFS